MLRYSPNSAQICRSSAQIWPEFSSNMAQICSKYPKVCPNYPKNSPKYARITLRNSTFWDSKTATFGGVWQNPSPWGNIVSVLRGSRVLRDSMTGDVRGHAWVMPEGGPTGVRQGSQSSQILLEVARNTTSISRSSRVRLNMLEYGQIALLGTLVGQHPGYPGTLVGPPPWVPLPSPHRCHGYQCCTSGCTAVQEGV